MSEKSIYHIVRQPRDPDEGSTIEDSYASEKAAKKGLKEEYARLKGCDSDVEMVDALKMVATDAIGIWCSWVIQTSILHECKNGA
jgi:hypothetical protein